MIVYSETIGSKRNDTKNILLSTTAFIIAINSFWYNVQLFHS